MPTPTYDLISEQVLGSATATVTFSSIPGTYKDLVVEIIGSGASVAFNGYATVTFNSDTGTNYSRTFLQGNGSTASSGRSSNLASTYWSFSNGTSIGTGLFSVMSYANTNVYKTVLQRFSDSSSTAVGVGAQVDLWRSTAAINRIDMTGSGANFAAGSTFRLWGIA